MKKIFFITIALFSCTLYAADKQTVLPLQFDTGNPSPYGAPTTNITIEGKTIPVIFDTGYSKGALALTEEALKGVPVKFPGTETCTHSLSGKNCYKDFVVSEVKIGDFILHDVKGQLIKELWDNKHNKNFKETAASRNGVVGVTLLKNFNILLDYAHAKAILTDKNQTKIAGYNMENWTHVPFTLSHGISTQALINGKAAVLVWDTGAIPSGIRSDFSSQKSPQPCDGIWPFGDTQCRLLKAEKFQIGKQNLPMTWFKLNDIPKTAPLDGFIGQNFFQEHLVFFNFADNTIAIDHP